MDKERKESMRTCKEFEKFAKVKFIKTKYQLFMFTYEANEALNIFIFCFISI